jgi:hypothetical protein
VEVVLQVLVELVQATQVYCVGLPEHAAVNVMVDPIGGVASVVPTLHDSAVILVAGAQNATGREPAP